MSKKDVKRRRSRYESEYPKASVLKVLSPSNPKKRGTKAHARFKLYDGCSTVGDFLENGGTYGELVYDVGRRFVQVTIIH